MAASRAFKQTATYWAPTSTVDKYGKMTYTAPAAVAVRWETRSESFQDKLGEEVLSKAKVFTQTDLNINGYLYLGTSVAASPLGVDGAYEIQQISKVPNLRNLQTMILAYL